VVWSSAATSIGTHADAFFSLLVPLRTLSFAAAVGVIVVVAQLRFLDNELEGRAATALRRATFAVLLAEFGFGLVRDFVLLADVGGFLYGSILIRILVFSLVPAAADLVFALWLGRILSAQKVQPFLPAVVAVTTCASMAAQFMPLIITLVNIAWVVAVFVEILRVRRVLA